MTIGENKYYACRHTMSSKVKKCIPRKMHSTTMHFSGDTILTLLLAEVVINTCLFHGSDIFNSQRTLTATKGFSATSTKLPRLSKFDIARAKSVITQYTADCRLRGNFIELQILYFSNGQSNLRQLQPRGFLAFELLHNELLLGH